jgi:hypothetical protein
MKKFLLTAGFLAFIGLGLRSNAADDFKESTDFKRAVLGRFVPTATPSLFDEPGTRLTRDQIDLLEAVFVLVEENRDTRKRSLVGYCAGEEIMSQGLLAQATPEGLAEIKAEIERVRGLAVRRKISDDEHRKLQQFIRHHLIGVDSPGAYANTYAGRTSAMVATLIPESGSIDGLKDAVGATVGTDLDRAISLIDRESATKADTAKFYSTLLKIPTLHETHHGNPEWGALLESAKALILDHTIDGRELKCESGARGRNLLLSLGLLRFIDGERPAAYGGRHAMGAGAPARPAGAPGAFGEMGGAGGGAAERPIPEAIRSLPNAGLFNRGRAWYQYREIVTATYETLAENEGLKKEFLDAIGSMNDRNDLSQWCSRMLTKFLTGE